jgi:VCBS repeat-containing protein
VVCTSLNEWAMSILKLPIQKQLDQAISSNTETKERWSRYQMKLQGMYVFKLDSKNYAVTKSQTGHKTTAILPRINYTNKTKEEIHFTINRRLQQGQLLIRKSLQKRITQ